MKKIHRSILEACHGAIKEKADIELNRILANIDDINTNPIKKRTLTITLEFTPNNDRKRIQLKANAKSKIEPTSPVETTLLNYQEVDAETGVISKQLHEVMDIAPGQINIDGEIAEQQILLIGLN